MTGLPVTGLRRVLQRVDTIWHLAGAAHIIVYGMTGSGKSTLIKSLLGLCEEERVLILDPKPHPDPVWDDPAGTADRWGRPVQAIGPLFGAHEEGGGPQGLWFRLTGAPDRGQTRRAFSEALAVVAAEGHCVLVLDDVREITRQLRLAAEVDSVMNLGRSANVLAVLGATEASYVAGRAQAAQVWVGHTSGLKAAEDGARLLGWRGAASVDRCAAVAPHEWIYSESEPGNDGPVLVTAG